MIIRFSKPFTKLSNHAGNGIIKSATLLQIIKLKSKNELSADFIRYDTDDEFYIPDDEGLLLLVFLKNEVGESNSKNIFTTIRIFTEDKWRYYTNGIGQTFEVVIIMN